MTVDPARIPQEGRRYTGEEPAEAFELEGDPFVKVAGPLRYDLHASVAGSELIVKGRLEVQLSYRCSRCCVESGRTLVESAFCCAKEIEDKSESVNLTAELCEAMILLFPSYPVCSDTCKGLCPQCGKNLNGGRCRCKPPGDGRWSALDALSA